MTRWKNSSALYVFLIQFLEKKFIRLYVIQE
ncbi:hypothetical protein vBEcoMWL3_gp131c [Escherichia phage vB_EcoM_WL-3]|nr:hypothetical protein vBEcoMWL3_gp131c [Escherichia phage vB_EcoM_WL-3]